MNKETLTHNDLVEIGYKWCLSRCGFAFKELRTTSMETPDVIGFNSNGTFLLEAKVSRSDFLVDKKKIFREHPMLGMGDWRFFIAPKGMIKIDELPMNWGLIEVGQGKRARISHNPFGKGNIYSKWYSCIKSELNERRIMYSALRRMHQNGVLEQNLNIER
nr:hypothetical protein [uncultured Allomuricauda sp.]